MIALATGSYDVLRGEQTNDWGDPEDATTVVATGVPMALQPGARGRTSRSEGGLRQVDSWQGWAPTGTDIQLDDRIRNPATGEIFVIAVAAPSRNILTDMGIRLELRRVASGA